MIDSEKTGKLLKQLFQTKQKLKDKLDLYSVLVDEMSNYTYPWEILLNIPALIKSLIEKYPDLGKKEGKIVGAVHLEGEDIYIGEGTVIQHGAMIKGPCIIGKGCQIRKGAYIRGNAILGDGCLLGNSTEVKTSILLRGCQVSHFNYIGDSVLGSGAHFAAGAITSNLKLDGSLVRVKLSEEGESMETAMAKFGALVGDHVQIGCNAVLNPGSIICKHSVVYPLTSFRGFLSPSRIFKLTQSHTTVEKK